MLDDAYTLTHVLYPYHITLHHTRALPSWNHTSHTCSALMEPHITHVLCPQGTTRSPLYWITHMLSLPAGAAREILRHADIDAPAPLPRPQSRRAARQGPLPARRCCRPCEYGKDSSHGAPVHAGGGGDHRGPPGAPAALRARRQRGHVLCARLARCGAARSAGTFACGAIGTSAALHRRRPAAVGRARHPIRCEVCWLQQAHLYLRQQPHRAAECCRRQPSRTRREVPPPECRPLFFTCHGSRAWWRWEGAREPAVRASP
jgi:hypothetical protein